MTVFELVDLLSQLEASDEVKIWSEFGNLDIVKVEKTDEGIVLS